MGIVDFIANMNPMDIPKRIVTTAYDLLKNDYKVATDDDLQFASRDDQTKAYINRYRKRTKQQGGCMCSTKGKGKKNHALKI